MPNKKRSKPKKAAASRPVAKKAAKKLAAKKSSSAKPARSARKKAKKKSPAPKAAPRKVQRAQRLPVRPDDLRTPRDTDSGSLQGLSRDAIADSESVDELLEEGNAFEAEAIEGVEDSPDPDRSSIHTREVPEDDVPEEYQDPEQ